jgi:hypothetical protein
LEIVMDSSLDRRSVLRGSVLATGAAVPLAAFAGAGTAQAAPSEGAVTDFDGGPAPVTKAAQTGVQFTGLLQAFQSRRWFTFNWPASWHMIWYAVSTTPRSGVIQVDSSWAVERASAEYITYWITVRNLSNQAVNIEGRYAVLNRG